MSVEIIPPKSSHKATVIIFHDAGSNGEDFKYSLKDVKKNFKYNNIKIVLPSATRKPYTPAGGAETAVWYDCEGEQIDKRENRQSMKEAYKVVEALIAEEGRNGVPPERIVIGGFAMGATLALHAGIVVNPKLAGIFSIGAFLHHDSLVYEELERRSKDSNATIPKIFMTHCEDDKVVPAAWSRQANEKIKEQGVRIAYSLEPYGGHSVGPSQMDWADRFIQKCLQSD